MAELPGSVREFYFSSGLECKPSNTFDVLAGATAVRPHSPLGPEVLDFGEIVSAEAYALMTPPEELGEKGRRVVKTIDEYYAAYIDQIVAIVKTKENRISEKDSDGTMTGSLLLAILGQHGEMRKDGRPHIAHCMAVAALVAAALDGKDTHGGAVALAYLHDTLEYAIDSTRQAGEDGRIVVESIVLRPSDKDGAKVYVTPRLVYNLFDRLGAEPEGDTVATALMAITKYVDVCTRKKIEKSTYDEGVNDNPLAKTVKIFDRLHNMLNPKPPSNIPAENKKNLATRQEYEASIEAARRPNDPSIEIMMDNARRVLDTAWPVYNTWLERPAIQGFLKEMNIKLNIGTTPPYEVVASQNPHRLSA